MTRQAGQVSAEWSLATGILILALFLPLAGDGQSVMSTLLASIRGFHEHSSWLLSLP